MVKPNLLRLELKFPVTVIGLFNGILNLPKQNRNLRHAKCHAFGQKQTNYRMFVNLIVLYIIIIITYKINNNSQTINYNREQR